MGQALTGISGQSCGAWRLALCAALFCALLVLLFANTASAVVQPPPPPTPQTSHQGFQVSQVQGYFTDEFGDPLTSIFLNELFGPLFPAVNQTGTHETVFSKIIGYFNIVAIGLGGLLFAWNATAGLLQTAHEGELLGRRWSSLWAPVRIVFAVGMLVPLPNMHGYNAVQTGVAYLVRGATMSASYIWEQASKEILIHQTPIAASAPQIPGNIVRSLYSIAVCRVIVEDQLAANPTIDARYNVNREVVKEPVNAIPTQGGGVLSGVTRQVTFFTLEDTKTNKKMRICGNWTGPIYDPRIANFLEASGITNHNMTQIVNLFMTTHDRVMDGLYRVMDGVAREKADTMLSAQAANPISNPTSNNQAPIAGAVIDANTELSDLSDDVFNLVKQSGAGSVLNGGLLADAISGGNACKQATQTGMYDLLHDQNKRHFCYGEGWIGAGKWYLTIARVNNAINVFTTTFGSVTEDIVFNQHVGPVVAAQSGSPLTRFFGFDLIPNIQTLSANIKIAANTFMTAVGLRISVADIIDFEKGGQHYAQLMKSFDRDSQSMIALSQGFAFNPTQLKLSTQSSGALGGDGRVVETLMSRGLYEWLDKLVNWLAYDGTNRDPLLTMMNYGDVLMTVAGVLVLAQVVPFVGDAIGNFIPVFWGAGTLLKLVLPMMPWFLWVVGVTGYFLLVVEAIIGASLWAFAHLRMDGEGISGNAVNGWTLLLSLLLTPVLMVFGFIVGMAIFRVTSTLLMSGLLPTFYSATAGTNMMTMLMLIPVMMLALGVMQLLLIERSFSMITELPNRVLSWIGGKADLMDQHAADRARVGMIATTAASGTIGGAAAKAVGSRVQRGWSRLRDRRAGTGGASQSDDRPTDS